MTELSLEEMSEKIETIGNQINTFEANIKPFLASAKKAMDDHDKPDEKKEEAKKAKIAKRDAAIKKAMEEEDEDKKEAAIRAAMDDYDDKPKESAKKGTTDEEKEKDAQIASILSEKRQDIVSKIMTANKTINPTKLPEIEARLKVASISELTKEWSILEPFVANVQTQPLIVQEPTIPYFASGIADPANIDKNQLNASSPDSAFAKFSTEELLGMNQ